MTLHSETLSISAPDGEFHGYFATPQTTTPCPGVLVVQEIFGVNAHIRSVVDRLAQAGYAALAHDVFWRQQPGIELGYSDTDIARGRALKAAMNIDEVIADTEASLTTLADRCPDQKLGVVGFCYGGLITYLAATRLKPACASSYYGGGIVDYLDEAAALDLPMQFHFGERDSAIPLDQVEQIRQAVSRNTGIEVFVYANAGHGFHCDQRGSYHPQSAEIAWNRTLALFDENLR